MTKANKKLCLYDNLTRNSDVLESLELLESYFTNTGAEIMGVIKSFVHSSTKLMTQYTLLLVLYYQCRTVVGSISVSYQSSHSNLIESPLTFAASYRYSGACRPESALG